MWNGTNYYQLLILTPGLSSAALAKEEGRKLHPSSSAPQITPRQASEAIAKRLHKRPKGATSSTFAQGYGGQARLLEFGEDVPASLHYAVARKKTIGFK